MYDVTFARRTARRENPPQSASQMQAIMNMISRDALEETVAEIADSEDSDQGPPTPVARPEKSSRHVSNTEETELDKARDIMRCYQLSQGPRPSASSSQVLVAVSSDEESVQASMPMPAFQMVTSAEEVEFKFYGKL